MLLCHADVTTKNEYKLKKYRNNFEQVKLKLKDVEERDSLRNWQPPVTGSDIMDTFNLKEGKEVKALVRDLGNVKKIKSVFLFSFIKRNPSNKVLSISFITG